jgi:signal transduction histidine kinase
VTIITIGLVIVGSILIARSIANPVTQLSNSTQQIATGDYTQRALVSGRDEIGNLAENFNTMVDTIQKHVVSLQAAREQAERSDKIKSAFLSSMSHELRTPLNAVINFTQFVIDGDVGPINAEQSELLSDVVGSAKHLLNLINDVLDMSKIEAGSLNLFVEDNIQVNAIVDNVIAIARGILANKSVQVTRVIDEHLPVIQGDRQRIFQILLNIVSNACKFTERGEIKVTTHQSDGELIIEIADTGPGIATEDSVSVFEAFKQTRTGLRQGGGTGLGMPISKSLAEAHGGRLWFESELGKGTKFYVSLPIKSTELMPVLA